MSSFCKQIRDLQNTMKISLERARDLEIQIARYNSPKFDDLEFDVKDMISSIEGAELSATNARKIERRIRNKNKE